ncbi:MULTISPECIES: lipid A export permease/ATP-binding protein MsbA [Nitrincola]|uniref:Lipid A export ATP-binding/permease protein MsbA n=1 Tax=Nitrincola nitratireducens TaxID=1229521 RepID=W9UZ81_9GAMM|nr:MULTISPECIES: lipid A export permease/ATP-binding protein MsbA [Nitrincola]EXJ12359.1 Lipid A export ATP-binding/permease protein MsbA [Nitrincola nitratireducens]
MQKELIKDSSNGWVVYRRLMQYVKGDWPMFSLALFGFVLYAATQTAAAKWLENFINAVEANNFSERGWLALSIILIFAVRGAGTLLGNYGFSYVARSLVNRLRCQMFDHLLVLPCSFYQQHSSAELLSRLTYNVEQVTGAATDALKTIVREGLTVVGLFGYMLYLNWKLTLLFVLVAPLVGAVVALASKRLRRLSHGIQSSVGDISTAASEAIKGYQVVRIFGGADAERERFVKVSERNRRQFMKMVVTQSISTPIVQMLVASVVALLTYIAMSPSLLESMQTGAFIAFISAASFMAKPIRQLTEVNSTIQKGLAAAESFFSLFDEKPEVDRGTVKLAHAKGKVEFRDVSFIYPRSEEPALKHISFVIQPGETVALVGRSGSGKSTMASLLPRFFDVEQGQILLDDRPLSDYWLSSLRSQIGLVNQHVVLFEGTIAENIAYGALANASEADIRAAADAAMVSEFADRLPAGLNTIIGENGFLLSGGQRQRIAIARAILKDAPLLILDEATSALDTESERFIQTALERVIQDRTTLIIAHRLSTIERADRILVMEHGQVVEQGSHAELLAKGGSYAALYNMQFSDM